jgi:hypothetical protein
MDNALEKKKNTKLRGNELGSGDWFKNAMKIPVRARTCKKSCHMTKNLNRQSDIKQYQIPKDQEPTLYFTLFHS